MKTVKCLYCGREFEKELHHKCTGGFRKHKHKWLKLKNMGKIEKLSEDVIDQTVNGASVSDIVQLITDFCQKEYEEKLQKLESQKISIHIEHDHIVFKNGKGETFEYRGKLLEEFTDFFYNLNMF